MFICFTRKRVLRVGLLVGEEQQILGSIDGGLRNFRGLLMKSCNLIPILLCVGVAHLSHAQNRETTAVEWVVAERGPHYKVLERVVPVQLDDGTLEESTNRYVEIATGLHYWDEGEWRESREEFEVLPTGYAVAAQGQHKVILSPVLNDSEGAVFFETPEGKVMRSTILGLSLRDRLTGEQLLIAEIVDTVGQRIVPNQVIFPDCFDDVHADVRFTYERGGFHQDVILRERFDPVWLEANGFNPDTTLLEIWTEFFEAPTPIKRARVISSVDEPALRAMVAEPDVVEEDLDFGIMKMHMGKAYAKGVGPSPELTAPMPKRWHAIDGRTFLVESISLFDLEPLLAALPGEESFKGGSGQRVRHAGARPPAPRLTRPGTNSVLTAGLMGSTEQPGVVLDYQAVIGSLTNKIFRSDTTYHVTGAVNCYGTTVIEGGTVLKYSSGTTAKLAVHGPLDCFTGPYRMAIFTAEDDNTAGQTISGSSGTPSGRYGLQAIDFSATGEEADLHHLRILHKSTGVRLGVDGMHSLRHSQVLHGNIGVALESANVTNDVENVLFANLEGRIWKQSTSPRRARASHLTVHQVNELAPSGLALAITNSLFVYVTNMSTVSFGGESNATNDSTSVFQTVGGGEHYLADNTYRDAGTEDINAQLLEELREMTTYPPLLMSNINISVPTTFEPYAGRDLGLVDIGYHYPALDYLICNVELDARTVIEPGVALGVFGIRGFCRASTPDAFICEGTVADPIWIVRWPMVQEGAFEDIYTGWVPALRLYGSSSNADELDVRLRYTRVSTDPFAMFFVRHGDTSASSTPVGSYRDCEFYGLGRVWTTHRSDTLITNCLFDRYQFFIQSPAAPNEALFHARNCYFKSGTIYVTGPNLGNNTFKDCVFDNNSMYGASSCTASHNGYMTGTTSLGGTGNVTTINPDFEVGPLGPYYYPTNGTNLAQLLNVGSQNSDAAGLYHFTTTTNQVKEEDSTVDIGYHYVALLPQWDGAHAVFLDTDNDIQGDWKHRYGLDGYDIIQHASAYPSYVQVGTTGESDFTWASSTNVTRALEKPASSDRFAGCWFATASWDLELDFNDDKYHRVALYFLDWNTPPQRTQSIEITAAGTSNVLDDRSISSFYDGRYLVWNIRGDVDFEFTKTGGANAVLSGIFFDVTDQLYIDTDADGVPDYLEDANGNGEVDTGETDWRDAADQGIDVLITQPADGSVIP
jgi:hypothetical protein